jgi:hypothetical protein
MRLSAKTVWLLLLTLVLAVAGLTAATQTVGALFHYHRALGSGWLELGGARAYAPWSVIGWHGRHAAAYPHGLRPGGADRAWPCFVWPLLIVASA